MPLRLSAVPGVLGEISRRRFAELEPLEGRVFAPPARNAPSFAAALKQQGLSLIAEVKRKSPSQGEIAVELDPAKVATAYLQGGARAISVLTEPHYFSGSDTDLVAVRAAVDLPILRKDFTVRLAQIDQAKSLGASAVLLIVAVLGDNLGEYLECAHRAGLDALVEVHDEAELELALQSGSRIIGVNNRNLIDLKIDLATAPRLGQLARDQGFEGLLVAESGYSEPAQLGGLAGLFDAVLIGTHLARSNDWGTAAKQITSGQMV